MKGNKNYKNSEKKLRRRYSKTSQRFNTIYHSLHQRREWQHKQDSVKQIKEQSMTTIVLSNIVTAFQDKTVGTKVIYHERFLTAVENAIEGFDWSTCKCPGQAFIKLDEHVNPLVSSGVGKKTTYADDYVIRMWRGHLGMYLKREKAEAHTGVAVVVYTKEAYLLDPDVAGDPEKGVPADPVEDKRIRNLNCEYVIVAVLTFAGPPSTVGYGRFVKNLAGANNEYSLMTKEDLVNLAIRVRDYNDTWMTVAD